MVHRFRKIPIETRTCRSCGLEKDDSSLQSSKEQSCYYKNPQENCQQTHQASVNTENRYLCDDIKENESMKTGSQPRNFSETSQNVVDNIVDVETIKNEGATCLKPKSINETSQNELQIFKADTDTQLIYDNNKKYSKVNEGKELNYKSEISCINEIQQYSKLKKNRSPTWEEPLHAIDTHLKAIQSPIARAISSPFILGDTASTQQTSGNRHECAGIAQQSSGTYHHSTNGDHQNSINTHECASATVRNSCSCHDLIGGIQRSSSNTQECDVNARNSYSCHGPVEFIQHSRPNSHERSSVNARDYCISHEHDDVIQHNTSNSQDHAGVFNTCKCRSYVNTLSRTPANSIQRLDSTNDWRIDSINLRSTHSEKSILAKKRVIRMLFVVVLEFFVCWTPIFIVNILALYIPNELYKTLGGYGISFLHLLSYASSCCNPITYCFMNRRFVQAFLHVFGCRKVHTKAPRVFGSNLSYRNQCNIAMRRVGDVGSRE